MVTCFAFTFQSRASKTCFLVHLQMCTPLAILLMYPLGNLFDRGYSEICSGQMNMLSFIRRTGKEMMRTKEIYPTVIWGLKYSWVNAREQGSCILDYVNRQGLKYNQTVSLCCFEHCGALMCSVQCAAAFVDCVVNYYALKFLGRRLQSSLSGLAAYGSWAQVTQTLTHGPGSILKWDYEA